MQQAVAIGYIRFNPATACTLPRAERKEIVPLDSEKSKAFIKTIQGDPFEAVFLVDILTGLRQSEILGLKWNCIDFEKETIRVDKQLQPDKENGGYIFVAPKNGKARSINPATAVMIALRKQRARQAEDRLKAGETWEDSGLVFTNELGQNLAHRTILKRFKKIVAEIGVPNARFHDLRHTYAVSAIRAGDDIKTVQENLGHATAARYRTNEKRKCPAHGRIHKKCFDPVKGQLKGKASKNEYKKTL